MPFVVRYSDGKYLFRSGAHKRKAVEDVSEATAWPNKGHAKNAARISFGDKWIREGRTREVEIVEVDFIPTFKHGEKYKA